MKTLIVCYSRTGNAKSLATVLSSAMHADLEDLTDVHPFTGLFGVVRAGFCAVRKALPNFCPPRYQPRDYERVIIVTPVWAGRAAAPMRSYLDQYGDMCKKLMLFTVSKGPSIDQVRDELQTTFGLSFENAVGFTNKELKSGTVINQLKSMSGQM